jgi:hypothetical protein
VLAAGSPNPPRPPPPPTSPLGSAALFPEESDLEAYEGILDATAEYMAATGDEVGGGA